LWRIEDRACPEAADEMRDHLGSGMKVESKKLKMRVETSLVDYTYNEMKIETREDKTLKISLQFDFSSTKSFTWVTPLTDDKTTYLINVKKSGLPLKGFVKFKGKQVECNETMKDCLIMYDIGRGYHNYGASYYWAFSQSVLPDGTTLVLNFGDGIGSEYHSHNKASEDHIALNGTIYKLDVTEMEYSKDDYLKPKTLKTASETGLYKKKFP
jgi:hypothetical protein